MSLFDRVEEEISSAYLDEVFGPTGLLSRRFPGYEPRPGQVALARTIDKAMRDGRHALGEGPCGTGKTVSYIAPAANAARSGRRAVIVTANNALSEQLVDKDLPMMASILPWRFTHALIKGRDNYLCRDALRAAQLSGDLADLRRGGHLTDDMTLASSQVDALVEWARGTEEGDRSELPFIPARSLWLRASVSADDCKGRDCDFYPTLDGGTDIHGDSHACCAEIARRRAHAANIVVTNYHLLFAHFKVLEATGQHFVLPKFDYLVLDEAHEAADIAREFFGFSLGDKTLRSVIKYAHEHVDRELAKGIRAASAEFFDYVGAIARVDQLRRPPDLLGMLDRVRDYALEVQDLDSVAPKDRADARSASRSVERFTEAVESAVERADQNKVFFVERNERGGVRLRAKVIDVSSELRARLFTNPGIKSVSMVSATLTCGGTFDFVRRELGVPPGPGAIEVVVESPFDFPSQALLVVPGDAPPAGAPERPDQLAEQVGRVIGACGGRTLCLFTSNKALDEVHARLRGRLPHRLLKQGDAPRGALVRDFTEDVSSVLMGVNSFWTGVDVPGEALTGLVIDKLPFPNKSDPVAAAITERDPKWFENFSMPRAIIMLRQGVGRLIRSRRDVGAVVILDRRIVDKFYGREFFKSLPAMRRSSSVADIERFLRGEALESPAAAPTSSVGRSMFDR